MKKGHYVMIGLAAIFISELEAVGPFTSGLHFAGQVLMGMYMGYGVLHLSERQKEIVICSAVRAKDGLVIRGHRHFHALQALHAIPGYEHERPWGDNQGFITSKNRYVTREEGYRIQKDAGIPSALEGTIHADAAYVGEQLYSEDLY